VKIGAIDSTPLYALYLSHINMYLVAFFPEYAGDFEKDAFGRSMLQNGIAVSFLKLDMQDLELENQQLFRKIEALKSQHTKLLEDNYSQYLMIRQKEKEYARELENEIARKTAKLREANARLKEASRLKSEFLANMSHELRTPMNAIVGFSDLLLETGLDEDQKDYVKTISSASDNLLLLINGILDLAKIEAGKMELEMQSFDLGGLVKDVSGMFAISTRGKNVALNCLVDPDIPAQIIGDANRLRQVLINLVGNAMKFTSLGRVDIHANIVRQTKDKVWITFAVQDTGIGIPEERQKAIFDKFTQADGSTTRRYGGSGLGLAICQELVKLMGGNVKLLSVPGEGSEFNFTIPLQIDSESQTSPVVEDTDEVVAKKYFAKGVHAGIRVLLVEDNLVNQKLAGILIRKQGCELTVAGDGREALDCIRKHCFDLVVMDVQMPHMDGIEATRKIRELEASPDKAAKYKGLVGRERPLPIVGLTAHARKEDERECLAAGMTGFLTKPIMKDKLVAVLRKEMVRVGSDEKDDT
jgi:signal transduction histidine kinase/FixJ family two-component response regulator